MEIYEKLKEYIDEYLRPKARVDGGDMLFESFDGETLVIGAHAECSDCICCHERMTEWLTAQIEKEFGQKVVIRFNRYVPYFK